MSERTDQVLRQITADMWNAPSIQHFVPKKRLPRYGVTAVAGIAVVAMTVAADAHYRRHSVRIAGVMCDNVDVMRPCYNGYRPFEPDHPRHVAVLSGHRHKSAPRLAASLPSGESGPKVTSDYRGADTGRGVVKASTGAVAYVAKRAEAAFQCLIDKLETEGVKIKEMGGFASSGHIRHSLHYRGLAMDVNQLGRNVTSPKMPADEIFLANSCGLTSGAEWHNADSGHFEIHLGDRPNIRIASHHRHRHHYVRRHVHYRYASW